MKNAIFIEISQYESLKPELLKDFVGSPLKNEFQSFWEQWEKLHIRLFQNLKLGFNFTYIDENELSNLVKKFMTKRQGMISAFAQGIKHTPHFKNEVVLFRNMIKQHDESFKILLKKISDKLLTELNRLQSVRKVTKAYMNSQFSLGG